MEIFMLGLNITIAIAFFTAATILFIKIRQQDARKRRVKEEILSNGISTVGVIKRAFSRSGGNSGFINATLEISFKTSDGATVESKADMVMDTLSAAKYQSGEKTSLRYAISYPKKISCMSLTLSNY